MQLYFSGRATAAEVEELFLMVEVSGDEKLATHLETAWLDYTPVAKLDKTISDSMLKEILAPAKVRRIRPAWWARTAVAASILAVVAIGIVLLQDKKPGEIALVETTHDIEAPKETKAMIRLADGRTVALESLSTVMQDGVQVIKNENGEVIYTGESGSLVYNTLSNPRGSEVVSLVLADGTRVWLNAASSLTYPVAFAGNERNVTITGEAYFEVAKDATKKFIVTSNGVNTEVLGTHFNVNAYEDDKEVRITLLEGLVQVSNHSNKVKILPGQQAVAANSIEVREDANLREVMAWKNGSFEFAGKDLETLMKEISRWYDVDIVYEGSRPEANFGGRIPRTANVREVLNALQLTRAVSFMIEGRKIIVSR